MPNAKAGSPSRTRTSDPMINSPPSSIYADYYVLLLIAIIDNDIKLLLCL